MISNENNTYKNRHVPHTKGTYRGKPGRPPKIYPINAAQKKGYASMDEILADFVEKPRKEAEDSDINNKKETF